MSNLGGIAIILNHCTIQDEHPFLRECALFALKNLTDGNLCNQEKISLLQPISFADSGSQKLDVTGTKISLAIENGKVHLKT